MDCQFPIITLKAEDGPRAHGHQQGESYKEAINELVQIRTQLMLAKNPSLKAQLIPLAMEQWYVTKRFSPSQAMELEAIAEAANLTITDLVILNNYTDFRDIELPEEGCSTIHSHYDRNVISGQTWDMHASAKRFLNVVHVKSHGDKPEKLFLSLVGCSGLMGMNTKGCLAGVNNINTKNARAGLLWPVLIRELLTQTTLREMRSMLIEAPVTSGHNYLLSDPNEGEHWEVTPHVSEQIAKLKISQNGSIFHTNHCIGESIQKIEDKKSLSSTTQFRYDLLVKNADRVRDFQSLIDLLQDHENEPKSICSHFENGAQDPSATCGGGVYDITKGDVYLWRGCPVYDKNYVSYKFKRDGSHFIKVS